MKLYSFKINSKSLTLTLQDGQSSVTSIDINDGDKINVIYKTGMRGKSEFLGTVIDIVYGYIEMSDGANLQKIQVGMITDIVKLN